MTRHTFYFQLAGLKGPKTFLRKRLSIASKCHAAQPRYDPSRIRLLTAQMVVLVHYHYPMRWKRVGCKVARGFPFALIQCRSVQRMHGATPAMIATDTDADGFT